MSWLVPWLASSFFMLLSIGLIPYAGIQEDEALFTNPFFMGMAREHKIRPFHHDIPIMVMSYVGALKTWIYWPILNWFRPSVWAIRLPVSLAGSITIFVFYHLVRRSLAQSSGAGRAALTAAIAVLLLATDPIFLLTNTFDWGPVALEHVLLVTGCLLLVRFASDSSKRLWLGLGFFCFGLALWNKALFVWALSGLTIAAITVFWRELKELLTWRNVSLAVVCFLLGALPFVVFNVRQSEATVNENVHLDFDHMSSKLLQLERAFNGSSMFGFMTKELDQGPLKPASPWKGRFPQWINEHLGEHRETKFFYVFGVLLLLVPFWWKSRAARFSLVFLLVAWGLMAITKNAGAAAHHVVLLWPFPALFAAITVASVPWRWLAISLAGALVVMNLLVVNQYFLQFDRAGAAGNFTDALIGLNRALPEGPTIYAIDWGMNGNAELAHQGRLHIQAAQGPLLSDSPDPEATGQLMRMLGDSDAVWVDHVTELEDFQGVGEHLERFATKAGYRRELLQTVSDSNGRPVFEIFRYR